MSQCRRGYNYIAATNEVSGQPPPDCRRHLDFSSWLSEGQLLLKWNCCSQVRLSMLFPMRRLQPACPFIWYPLPACLQCLTCRQTGGDQCKTCAADGTGACTKCSDRWAVDESERLPYALVSHPAAQQGLKRRCKGSSLCLNAWVVRRSGYDMHAAAVSSCAATGKCVSCAAIGGAGKSAVVAVGLLQCCTLDMSLTAAAGGAHHRWHLASFPALQPPPAVAHSR